MHDNTLARALSELGVDVQLVPMYTPIQTDEADVTVDQVFFGGINVYLQQRIGLFRYLPRCPRSDPRPARPAALDRFARASKPTPPDLGDLAVSMLRGSAGFQRKEVPRLCQWLSRDPKPHLVNLSNVLIAGCVPELRAALQVPITVTLQGDDVFLAAASRHDTERRPCSRSAGSREHVDAFLVHSEYYADFMADYLGCPATKFRRVPLGIDVDGYAPRRESGAPEQRLGRRALQIGYLARLAPEKGLHVLVDAFLLLRQMPGRTRSACSSPAGWASSTRRTRQPVRQTRQRGAAATRYEYLGYDRSCGRNCGC